MGALLVLSIATLVLKPWSAGAPQSGQRAPAGLPATSPRPGPEAAVAPDRAAAAAAPSSAATANVPLMEPDRWAYVSAILRTTKWDGVVSVGRDEAGLFLDFVPITPSGSATQEPPAPDGTSNTVDFRAYASDPLALGFTRPEGADLPVVVGWQIPEDGRPVRLAMTHPVGDTDRFLFISIAVPRGERNIRELSRRPPQWQAGLYRFDITNSAGTRYAFVLLGD